MDCVEAKLYPELSAAFLREHLDRAGALWYLLRAYDTAGSGAVRLGPFCDWLEPSMSRRTIERHLRQGEPVFWVRKKRRGASWRETVIIYRGLERICEYFGVLPTSRPVICAVESLAGYAKSRAAMLQSWLASRDGKPTSTATIEAVTGVKRGAAWRYTKDTAKQRNVACMPYADDRQVSKTAWTRKNAQGVVWYFWTIPTSYFTNLRTTTRGRCRKVVSQLRRGNEAPRHRRRYYLDPLRARKDKRRDAPYLVLEGVRHESGLWRAYA
jgi:hypothetical protein